LSISDKYVSYGERDLGFLGEAVKTPQGKGEKGRREEGRKGGEGRLLGLKKQTKEGKIVLFALFSSFLGFQKS